MHSKHRSSIRHRAYRRASARVRARWIRNSHSDSVGGVCLVSSINESIGHASNAHLPPRYRRELHWHLMRYPSYWLALIISIMPTRRATIQESIEKWNDWPWRRQQTVATVLERLSRRHAPVRRRTVAAVHTVTVPAVMPPVTAALLITPTTLSDAQVELTFAELTDDLMPKVTLTPR